MADSVTYDKLLTLAAVAAGLDRAALSTDEATLLNDVPNEAVEHVADARKWPRIALPYRFRTQAPYATGTVTATNNSTTVTLAGGTWPTWAAGAEIVIDGSVYTVASRDSGVQLTLTQVFSGTTAAGKSYTLRQNFVYLPADFQKFERNSGINWASAAGRAALEFTSAEWINEQRAAGNVANPPTHCALAGSNATGANAGQLRLELWPAIEETYEFVTVYRRRVAAMATGSDQPDLPLELHRAVRTLTQFYAKLRFERGLDPNLEALAARQIADAWNTLNDPGQNVRTLCDVHRQTDDYPTGANMQLDANW